VAPADAWIVAGLKETVRPIADGGTEAVSSKFPTSPTLLTVTTEVAELPATKLAGEVGLAEIVKSESTVNTTSTLGAVTTPLLPPTVTL